jgi:hypothetical protein
MLLLLLPATRMPGTLLLLLPLVTAQQALLLLLLLITALPRLHAHALPLQDRCGQGRTPKPGATRAHHLGPVQNRYSIT